MSKAKNLQTGAANATQAMFSGAAPSTAPAGAEQEQPKAAAPKPVGTEPKAAKADKKVFSFRADASIVAGWRAYADAKTDTLDAIATAAMQEYIKSHPLTAEEQEYYNLTVKLAEAKAKRKD